MVVNGKDKYRDNNSRETVINYIINHDKMPHDCYGGFKVDSMNPAGSMNDVAVQYGKENGVQLRHIIIGFDHCVQDPYLVQQVAQAVAKYIAQEYQVVYAVHENTPNLHIHVVFNAVSYLDGHRYRGTRQEHHRMMDALKRILHQYQLPQPRYVSKIQNTSFRIDDYEED